MRHHTTRALHGTAATAAVIGTVSLALGASPAAAAQPAEHRPSLRATPTGQVAAVRATTAAAAPTHVVQAGDTVSAIAARYGLRTNDVLAWNGLGWSTIIRPGQIIVLAPPPAPAGAATAASAPPATPAPAPAASHTVRGGDTLWAIARAGGVSLDALLSANGLTRDSIIYPGQTLVVPAAPAATSASAPAPALGLDAEQVANAQLIIRVGRERGVPDRGIAIALATAMVESWIRNLDWGDRDSLGLFQQRPSTGWGSPDDVRDPARAAAAFYGGAGDPNGARTRGLLDIPGWESMAFSDAAQAVQVSDFPDRYGAWEQQAYAWLAALG